MYDHNAHFHDYLLNNCPPHAQKALDIGCGTGQFAAKLAKRCASVDAIDVDAPVIQEAQRQNPHSNIDYLHANFLDLDLPSNSYDVVTAIASLHHMDLKAAFEKIRGLLRPNGKLIVLGLYQESTLLDHLYSTLSVGLNAVYSIGTSTNATSKQNVAVPVRQPALTLNQIKQTASDILPSCTVQRHVLWRYSLIWSKLQQ